MGLMDAIDGRTTYLDANIFIYAVEGHEKYSEPLGNLFRAVVRHSVGAFTSELTLAEVLVKPFHEAQPDLVEHYRSVVQTHDGLTVTPVTRAVLVEAAPCRLRPQAARCHPRRLKNQLHEQ